MGTYVNTLSQDIGPRDSGSPSGIRIIHAGARYEAEGDVEEQILEMPGQVEVDGSAEGEAAAAAARVASGPEEGDPLGEQEARRRAVAASIGGARPTSEVAGKVGQASDPLGFGTVTSSQLGPQGEAPENVGIDKVDLASEAAVEAIRAIGKAADDHNFNELDDEELVQTARDYVEDAREELAERTEQAGDPAPSSLSAEELEGKNVSELKKLAEDRNVKVTRGDGKEGDPVKADYVKALSS